VTVKISYADFVDLLMEKSDTSKTKADLFMHTLTNILHTGLDRDGQVVVRGLGQFELRWQNERMGRNIQTGEPIEIPAHYKINFRPDATLRRFFNRKYANLKPKYLPHVKAQRAVDIHPVEEAKPEPILEIKKEVRETPPAPAPKKAAPSVVAEQTEKSKSRKWAWIAIPVIIVVIILLLVFKKDSPAPVAETAAVPVQETPPVEEVIPEEKPVDLAFPGGMHQVKPGDQLWGLSGEYYDSQYLWPYIYGENAANVKNPDFLNPASELTIPPLTGNIESLTQTDKVQIAEGYMKTYFAYKRVGRREAHTYLWTAYQLGGESIIQKYSTKIDKADLNRIRLIEGQCQI